MENLSITRDLDAHLPIMVDWSKLPFDLLYDIVMRFETIEDFVYFSVVCRLWNICSKMVKEKFNVKTTPWLLLSEDTENNPSCLRKVFNPSNDKYYQLELPETFGCRCWGSVYGWLVIYSEQLDLHLFNPLTKAKMSLPPITSMPYLCQGDFPNPHPCTLFKMRQSFIKKAFVLKVDEQFIVVLAYYFRGNMLAFARPGDQSWTAIDHPRYTPDYILKHRGYLDDCVAEVMCRQNRILILYGDASLAYLDVSDLADPQKLSVRDYLPVSPMTLTDPRNLGIKLRECVPAHRGILDDLDKDQYGLYMVDLYGDLLMVVRDRCFLDKNDDDGPDYATFGFKVYQLDFDKNRWYQIHHLNDTILFLGCGSSMAVPAARSLNCKFSRIYYSDDQDDAHRALLCWGYDVGIFDLETSAREGISDECYADSNVQSPLWFIPQF